MEIENTKNESGKKDVAFIFSASEKKSIQSALKRRISDVNRTLKRYENHPNDDGQVTYSERRKDCRLEIEFLNELIEQLY